MNFICNFITQLFSTVKSFYSSSESVLVFGIWNNLISSGIFVIISKNSSNSSMDLVKNMNFSTDSCKALPVILLLCNHLLLPSVSISKSLFVSMEAMAVQ